MGSLGHHLTLFLKPAEPKPTFLTKRMEDDELGATCRSLNPPGRNVQNHDEFRILPLITLNPKPKAPKP